ncbi:MAG: hypothetical protein A2X25_01435 [Chloroflexi bacterium GWB2_49_20]|nr:MAG: hypothetical protein A2X25_01435 [Chloroflexi bacterium GWB2_49_20]OGN78117.1 MAG: hypothetical protein A2X26_14040 [Chloroflexi bacterium GWC2_49_37]OGN85154.1 MAG: hypothetical protein A2X27_06695 [Chloroflexi bacterium GWD2_49_16]
MQPAMIWSNLNGLMWLLLMLVPLIFLQRLLYREFQAVFILITHKPGMAISLFALVFLPGVFLHELSHLVVARLVGVRTGRFSLLPRPMPDGHLQLGYVETSQTDWIRASLIGTAPLIVGGLFVAFAANYRMELPLLWDVLRKGQIELFWMGVVALPNLHDFWLWFYLTFVVSSTMLPSNSDRHAWLPLGFVLILLFGLAVLVGAGPWMLDKLAPPINSMLRALAMLFGISVIVHAILLLPIAGFHKILVRITGFDIG